MAVDVICARGTGEQFGGADNMLTGITSKLDDTRYRTLGDLPYPASIGVANQTWAITGPSEAASIIEGVDNLAGMIRDTPNKVALLGYSLGAEIVTRFLERQACGEFPDCEIAWSACVANPLRRDRDSIDPNPYGWGINGQHADFPAGHTHFEVANVADAITSCPPDSPLRDAADVVSAFGLAQIDGWTHDLADRMQAKRWQPVAWGWWLHPVRTWQLYDTAAADVYGYLHGAHNLAYENDGYFDRLAALLNALAG